MKVTIVLRNDHEVLRGLIDKLKKTPARNPDRKALIQKIRAELQMHSQMASEVFYSALAATPSDRAVELAAAAQKRCEDLEELFQELSHMSPSDHHFDTKMNSAIAEIELHIELEEDELFHEARKTLPEYRLEELGLEMQSRRDTMKMRAVI